MSFFFFFFYLMDLNLGLFLQKIFYRMTAMMSAAVPSVVVADTLIRGHVYFQSLAWTSPTLQQAFSPSLDCRDQRAQEHHRFLHGPVAFVVLPPFICLLFHLIRASRLGALNKYGKPSLWRNWHVQINGRKCVEKGRSDVQSPLTAKYIFCLWSI